MKADIRPRNISPLLWEALRREHKQDVTAALARRLRDGARGSGMKLTPQECTPLLQTLLPPPKRGRGRPAADFTETARIAMCCFAREWSAKSVRAAVDATARALGVSRSTVWKARKLF